MISRRNTERILSRSRTEVNDLERRVIIAGTRDFSNYELLRRAMSKEFGHLSVKEISEMKIVSGCCRGADQLGEEFAKNNQLICVKFPADWNQYGKKAGPIRNEEMAVYAAEEHGVLMAFWDGKSRGTQNMIKIAEKYGLDVHVISV